MDNTMDMTKGSAVRHILVFSLPLLVLLSTPQDILADAPYIA